MQMTQLTEYDRDRPWLQAKEENRSTHDTLESRSWRTFIATLYVSSLALR